MSELQRNELISRLGVAMGSLLGPALANIFMCSFESKWFRDCPNDLKPVFYRRYIDDIFVLFSTPDHADKFREYLPSKHPNINFFIEKEEDYRLPFLDIKIFRENDKFATSVYRKKTFSGVYTNFKCFIPETYKIGLNHYYFSVSVCALILSNFIMRLIN